MQKYLFLLCVLFNFSVCKAQYCNFNVGNAAGPEISLTSNQPGQITTTIINWGDGATETYNSAAPSRTHTYCANGTYALSVVIYVFGVYNCTFNQQIVVNKVASLHHTQNNNLVNFQVSPYGSYCQWDFGDGTILNGLISQSHVYTANGTYYPVLKYSYEPLGCQFFQLVGYDTVVITTTPCITHANYTYTAMGYTANFKNTSTCNTCTSSTSYWDFGDGTTSSLTNPSHTFNTGGTHQVCLINTGQTTNMIPCSDTICKSVQIVYPPCNLAVDYSTISSGSEVNFNNLSTCSGCTSVAYEWNFGDDSSSNLANPTHTYLVRDDYFACLTTTGIDSNQSECLVTKCKNVSADLPNEMAVFPNPVTDKIFIKVTSSLATLNKELYNSIGQLLFDRNENEIDVRNYSKGLYYLKVGNIVKKIVIE